MLNDSNGNSYLFAGFADDTQVRCLPFLFRAGIPGFEGGHPPC